MSHRSLVLAGGGLKVGYQAGVLQVWLDEAGLKFDHADGASGGVAYGGRTRNLRIHNPMLCRLS